MIKFFEIFFKGLHFNIKKSPNIYSNINTLFYILAINNKDKNVIEQIDNN